MQKLAIIAALAALGLAGYVHLQADERDQRVDELLVANGELRDRLTDLQVRMDAGLGEETPSALHAAGDAALPEGAAAGTPGAPAGLAVRKPASPLERLASLEQTVAAQKDTIAKLEEERAQGGARAGQVTRMMPDNIYFNVDQAAKALGLDERQKADMQDTLDRATADLKDLYAVENDEGVTWNEVRKPKMANLGGDGDSISIALPDFGKIEKFKKSRIPGSSETFGEAEKRIREQAFATVRRSLPPDKATTWDKAHKDGLLRDGGGAAIAFSSMVVSGDK